MIEGSPRLSPGKPRLVTAGSDDPAIRKLIGAFLDADPAPLLLEGVDARRRAYLLQFVALRSPVDLSTARRLVAKEPRLAVILAGQLIVAGEHLEAEALVTDGLRRGDPVARILSIVTARALQLGPEVAGRRFDDLNAMFPWDPWAVASAVAAFTPKGGGSEELLLTFADRIGAEAPIGSPVQAAIAEIVVELSFSAAMNGDPQRARALFHDPELLQRVDVAARRSIHAAAWPGDTVETARALNLFAFLYWRRGDLPAAHAVFQRLGGACTETPWAYQSADPLQPFLQASRASTPEAPPAPDAAPTPASNLPVLLAIGVGIVFFAGLIVAVLTGRFP